MSATAPTGPHRPSPRHVSTVMGQVIIALIPAVAVHTWVFGVGVLIQLGLVVVWAYLLEALALWVRRRPIRPFMSDHSAVLAAVLLGLCLPPLAPWWVGATGMVFAIVIAKQLYGGLGHNLFNPAMVGFAVVIIAFPESLTQWVTPRSVEGAVPGLTTALVSIFTGQLPPALGWDALSQATPLDQIRQGLAANQTLTEIHQDPMFGRFGSAGWEWIALAYLAGGLYLIKTKIITWHVPGAVLIATVALSLPGWLIDPDQFRSPLQQLMSGALMMAAFFIATDPVTGSATPKGKIVFGVGVVVITLAIRAWGGFPDGVAFGILLMNLWVPLIDAYTQPRIFGHGANTRPKRPST
ncbi:MAG: RnfABCDGE type electron transport complex subunit D [Wenzhouxiangella sp.]|nr:RnfABCDGE type electron transport complex subunit D [Wenzhouxiangella sp.]